VFAHLLRLAYHCQQRVCICLLIASEQCLGAPPPVRRDRGPGGCGGRVRRRKPRSQVAV